MGKLILLTALLFVGCSVIQYRTPDATFSYTRIGNQKMTGLMVVKNVDGVEVELGSQKSEREIAEVILSLSKNVDKALEILNELQKKFPGLF